jgi:hypothetical protein
VHNKEQPYALDVAAPIKNTSAYKERAHYKKKTT